jgi:outer membrane protein assembly factor BamB
MVDPNSNPSLRDRPLRLWPGVGLVVLQWLTPLIASLFPDAGAIGMLAAVGCGVGVLVWWLFFSRAPWSERLGAPVLMAAVLALTYQLVDRSIATGGMGYLLGFYAVPCLCLGLVVWAAVSHRFAPGPRWALLATALALSCVPFTLLRTGGFTGDLEHELAWRWSPTPEERLLAATAGAPTAATAPRQTAPADAASVAPSTVPEPTEEVTGELAGEPATVAAAPANPVEPVPASASQADGEEAMAAVSDQAATASADPTGSAATAAAADSAAVVAAETVEPAATARPVPAWPGFRGADRNGIVPAVRLATNWSARPPVELWRRPVGPGWSSFAVAGDHFYTQEQRGEDEMVSCYRLGDGEPVWQHADRARFWESNAGAGPRATPALADGQVYTLGATGILNALDAATGAVLWSRNTLADTGAEIPGWGISGSPLVQGDMVLVAVSGRLASYDRKTGALRWSDQGAGASYSSPHLASFGGVPQVLLQRGREAVAVAPADGAVLWRYEWPSVSIVQPATLPDGDLLLSDNDAGLRRLAVRAEDGAYTLSERWTTIGLKPYFSDFVVHQGHAYGFDGSYLAAVDLASGQRVWKGGRYGNGQLVLLAEQSVLLVLSEKGELALVDARPDGFRELARAPAITGKTWNHPVLIGDVLLVRNDREMAAFRLATEVPEGDQTAGGGADAAAGTGSPTQPSR